MQGGGLLEDLYSLRLREKVVYYVLSDEIAVSELMYLYIVALLLSSLAVSGSEELTVCDRIG